MTKNEPVLNSTRELRPPFLDLKNHQTHTPILERWMNFDGTNMVFKLCCKECNNYSICITYYDTAFYSDDEYRGFFIDCHNAKHLLNCPLEPLKKEN